jgi:hypothetical protein
MILAWHRIAPEPHHHSLALTCGAPACAPWRNQGCAAGFLAEGRLVMSEQTNVEYEQLIEALESPGPLCDHPAVQALLEERSNLERSHLTRPNLTLIKGGRDA